MGRTVISAVHAAPGLEVSGLFDPGCVGEVIDGLICGADYEAIASSDVVVEFTRPDVVMENLAQWHELGLNVVVGTSGFDDGRLADLRESWSGKGRCLVVPNFSIGALLMMRFAEQAADHYQAVEIIESHHDNKADAPSGTAIATADRINGRSAQQRAVESEELHPGALGATVSGTRIHSVRLPGLLAHQEVLLGNPGELLTIRHDSTSRESFMPGVLLAIRSVASLPQGVSLGLEHVL